MRVLLKPQRVALGQFRNRQHPSAEPTLQILVQHLWLEHIFDQFLGQLDVFRALWDRGSEDPDLRRHLLAVVVERLPLGHDVVVFLFFVVEATSVEIEPSKSITMSFAWNALLSSTSFQPTTAGGT